MTLFVTYCYYLFKYVFRVNITPIQILKFTREKYFLYFKVSFLKIIYSTKNGVSIKNRQLKIAFVSLWFYLIIIRIKIIRKAEKELKY